VSQGGDWGIKALCRFDPNPHKWLSPRRHEIEEAREICHKCTVRPECLFAAVYEGDFVGVNAGLTEIEYLMKTWEEVEFEHETNWRKSDRLIQDLFREIL